MSTLDTTDEVWTICHAEEYGGGFGRRYVIRNARLSVRADVDVSDNGAEVTFTHEADPPRRGWAASCAADLASVAFGYLGDTLGEEDAPEIEVDTRQLAKGFVSLTGDGGEVFQLCAYFGEDLTERVDPPSPDDADVAIIGGATVWGGDE